jgi:hypothetical protein
LLCIWNYNFNSQRRAAIKFSLLYCHCENPLHREPSHEQPIGLQPPVQVAAFMHDGLELQADAEDPAK